MTSNHAKNELEATVMRDLAAICKKIAECSAVPDDIREQASAFVKEHDVLAQYRGRRDAYVHYQGESLLTRMARFLPQVLELEAWPENESNL